MTVKSTLYRHTRTEDSSGDRTPLICLSAVGLTELKARPAETSRHYLCDSAFLAERGCFSRGEPPSHSWPAPRHF
jgi:hypothetical protein